MEILYERGLAPLPTTEKESRLMKRLKEQFYWPLSIAMLLLILEVFIPDRKTPKKSAKEIMFGPPAAQSGTMAVILALLFLPGAWGSPSQALKKYQKKDYRSAYTEYQRLFEKNPADARLAYNAGAAAYQAQDFDAAAKSFQSSLATSDPGLQQQSYYNLGNAEFRLGQSSKNPEEKMGNWEEAIEHYDAALKLNPKDRDALYNKQLVEKRLEELKKEQQKQQQKKNQQKNDQKKQDQDKKNNEQQNKNQQQQKKNNQKNNSQQDQKSQEQNEKQNSEGQQKQEEERQKQASNEEKKEQKKSKQANPSKSGTGKESDQDKNAEEAQSAQYAKLGKMTPSQARQLLDAQKGDEKAMIFIPRQSSQSAKSRSFKDW
jgi:Ca-activated chloride channel family protein